MSQKLKVLEHLKKGRKITSLSALQLLGIISLPKRISDLRADGHKIKKVPMEVQKPDGSWTRIKVYSL